MGRGPNREHTIPDLTSSLGDNTLPKISKTDLLARYRQRVRSSIAWREREGYDALWRRLIDMYRGKQFSRAVAADEDRIMVNIAFATINVIEPSIAISSPKFTVSATDPDDEDRAVITEAVVNYWWRHDDIKPEFRRGAKDDLCIGHGWEKVGWRYAEGVKPRKAEDIASETDALKSEADRYAIENPDMAAQLPSDSQIEENVPTDEPFIITDRPFVERVSPFDMYVDPEATCMSDLKWIAQKVVRPLEDVQADDRYPAGRRRRLQSDSVRADGGIIKGISSDPLPPTDSLADDIKRVTLWEFYDMQRRTVCVFTAGGSKEPEFLLDPQPLPYSYGHPYVMFRSYDVPDHFYPIGDLEMLEPMQAELNKTRSAMMNNRKAYARKYLVDQDMLTKQSADALVSGVDGALVMIDTQNGQRTIQEAIQPLPITPLAAEMYNWSDTITQDADRVSGVNEYQRGELPETRRTATEASIIQDAANARASDKLAQIETVARDIAYRLVALAQMYMSGEQIVRVVGPQGKNIWVPFDREDIAGEFDFEVEAGSTKPLDDTQRRQEAMQVFNTLLPFMQPNSQGQVIVSPQAVITNFLKSVGIKQPEKFLVPPPPPMAAPQIDPTTGQPLPPDPQQALQAGPTGQGPSDSPPSFSAAAQIAGQVGFNGTAPNINGGGALGPGAQK